MASPIPLDLGLLAPHDLLRSSAYSLSTEAMQILLRKDLTYENIAPDMRAELNMIGAKQLGEQTGKLTSFLLGTALTTICFGVVASLAVLWSFRESRARRVPASRWGVRAFMILIMACSTTYTGVVAAHTNLLFARSFGQYFAFYVSDWKATPLTLAVLIQLLITSWLAGRVWITKDRNHLLAWICASLVTVCLAFVITYRIRVPQTVLQLMKRSRKDVVGMLGSLLAYDMFIAVCSACSMYVNWEQMKTESRKDKLVAIVTELQVVPIIFAGVMISTAKDYASPDFSASLLFTPQIAVINLFVTLLNQKNIMWLHRQYISSARLDRPKCLPLRLIHVEQETVAIASDVPLGAKTVNRTPQPPRFGPAADVEAGASSDRPLEVITARVSAPPIKRQTSGHLSPMPMMAGMGMAHLGTMGVAFGTTEESWSRKQPK